MKKKIITLVGVLTALIVLIAACVLIIKFGPKNSSGDTAATDDNIAVSQVGAENIVSFSFCNEDTGFETLRFDRNSSNEWHYSEKEDFPLNQSYVTVMAKTLAEIDASRVISSDEAGELSEYGFDNPSLTVWFKEKDGTEHTFLLGNRNETTENYYFKMSDDDNVYLIDGTLKIGFMYNLYDLFDKEQFPLVETSSYKHVDIKNGDKHIQFNAVVEDDAEQYVKDDYIEKDITWYVCSGDSNDYKLANQVTAKAMAEEMTAFEYYRAVDYKVSEADYSKYGFDNPTAVITVDYQVLDESTAELVEVADGINEVKCDTIDKKYTLYIGKVCDDSTTTDEYYVRVDGSDKVYTMEASVLSRYVNLNTESFYVSDIMSGQ